MVREPFKAVPLRPAPVRARRRNLSPILVALPLAAFTAVFLWPGEWPGSGAVELPRAAGSDRESARFGPCEGAVRVTCVVDGDTLWYQGEKIRLADINAPEVSEPDCAEEARLGARATRRLEVLLNAGAFTLAPNTDGTGRDRDKYGRLLRTVTRDGASLGQVLVAEGLAEEWQGYRRSWC